MPGRRVRLRRINLGYLRPVDSASARAGLWPVLFFLAMALCCGRPLLADSLAGNAPAIGIIIDDLGKTLETGLRVLDLPGPVACSFLPHQRYTRLLAEEAHRRGKEVLLHLPMDSVDGRRLDTGAVTLDMTERQFLSVLQNDLESVPFAVGVNNHMGSLLTRHPGHMLWLMREIRRQAPMLFVDSRTTVATVARQVAEENSVPAIDRDVFLDNTVSEKEIAFQFRRLLRLARERGTAVAIGHPHPQTLALLAEQLPALGQQGIRLLPVTELISLQREGDRTWQASWSRSPKAAKN
jgi:polysaccharide deacetylase 2 family uncharacterized protein YibQ